MPLFVLAMLWCNLFRECGLGWDEIHKSFSFQQEGAASCGWHFLALGLQKRRTRWEGDEPSYFQKLWYCNYCNYFHYIRLESIMASLRTLGWINATQSQKRFVIWVQDTVRFCVMAGSTTSCRRMLRAEWGRTLGSSKQPWKTRLLSQMKRSFSCR